MNIAILVGFRSLVVEPEFLGVKFRWGCLGEMTDDWTGGVARCQSLWSEERFPWSNARATASRESKVFKVIETFCKGGFKGQAFIEEIEAAQL